MYEIIKCHFWCDVDRYLSGHDQSPVCAPTVYTFAVCDTRPDMTAIFRNVDYNCLIQTSNQCCHLPL